MCLGQDHGQVIPGNVTPGAVSAINPYRGQKQAVQAGEQRFKQVCSACHGPEAEGSRGPALAENPDLRTMTDDRMFHIIQEGIPGTSMPPSALSKEATWEVAAYLRSLNDPISQTPVSGDAEAGRKLYFGTARCSECHAIRGTGGVLASDLSNIGGRMTAKQLRQSIVSPDSTPHIGFEAVTIIFKDGKQLKGVARNNSNYSMQVVDQAGKLHLLEKADLKEIIFDEKSFMPDNYAQTLGPDGVNNIMAFLAEQVARPAVKRPQAQAKQ